MTAADTGDTAIAMAGANAAGKRPLWFVEALVLRLAVPLLLFSSAFSFSVLDPTNVGWLDGDLGVSFLGWTAFRFDSWHWPLGLTTLTAYPYGVPLIATDSNPLVSIPLKLLSPLLPTYFQYNGIWYLLSLFISYNIALTIFSRLSGRYILSALAASIVALAPIFVYRWAHNTLESQWIILAALSVFLFSTTNKRAIASYALLHVLAISIQPYFLPMIFPIAGMDLIRRAHAEYTNGSSVKAISVVLAGLAGIVIPVALVAWAIGYFELSHVGDVIGLYSSDPLGWFNPMETSLFFKGWAVGGGQYEGFQYLGLGGIFLVAGGAVLWMLGFSRPERKISSAALWLIPAFVVWYALAVTPVVRVFGQTLLDVDVSHWPAIGTVLSTFRSSGRVGWPITYFALIFGITIWLAIKSRVVVAIMAVFLLVQLADISPLMTGTRRGTGFTGQVLPYLAPGDWARLVNAARRVYVSPSLGSSEEAQPLLYRIGSIAFPKRVPMSRFYFAQNMTTGVQGTANAREDDDVQHGRGLDDNTLYILEPADVGALLQNAPATLKRIRIVDGYTIIEPRSVETTGGALSIFSSSPAAGGLYELVNACVSNCAVMLAVRDDARARLSNQFIGMVDSRGGHLGQLPFRGSYAALMVNGRIIRDIVSPDQDAAFDADVFGRKVHVMSGGNGASNASQITVDGVNFSPDERGINLVELTPQGLSAIASFDTDADASASLPAPGALASSQCAVSPGAGSCDPFHGVLSVSPSQTVETNVTNPDVAQLLGQGWSAPEKWGTWTDGNTASAYLDLGHQPTAPLNLVLNASAFSGTHQQDVTLRVGGKALATLTISTGPPATYTVPIPPDDFADGRLDLEFDIAAPVSPKALGQSDDARELGLGLYWLSLKGS